MQAVHAEQQMFPLEYRETRLSQGQRSDSRLPYQEKCLDLHSDRVKTKICIHSEKSF